MLNGWLQDVLAGIRTINEILTAGIAITAFSLFLYALSFNLRDRVARSFAIILLCVVVVFTSEALESSAVAPEMIVLFLRLEWLGIIFLPPAYLQLSDAILVTTGRPSRGRRRIVVRAIYLVSSVFLLLLGFGYLLGPLVMSGQPAPHLQRTIWTEFFTAYYAVTMVLAWINFRRAYRHTLTRSGRRRMIYLLAGATAPALGSFPYLLYGSSLAESHPYLFWGIALVSNLLVGGLIIIMAYAVAFFGVSWPDRVVKSRLFKWIMRGPVTASVALGVMTIVRRVGEFFGTIYSGAVPAAMVTTVLLMEHTITLVAPLWERFIFFGRDRADLALLQNFEERLITQNDLRQFLESVLAAVRDHLQSQAAFVAALEGEKLALVELTKNLPLLKEFNLSEVLHVISHEGNGNGDEYIWGDYWIFPLHRQADTVDGEPSLIGLVGALRSPDQAILPEQRQALRLLIQRASMALQDRILQKSIFRSLEDLRPQVDMFQRLRAVGRYDSKTSLLEETLPPESDMAEWVRDALTHYWGGPKLTQNPLLNLQIVQEALDEHNDNSANALRSILRQAMDNVRPEGDRRFTGEWILFNILEMKFVEGRKVREVASRLAMSEADLYRKQRVAIEEVARVILKRWSAKHRSELMGRRLDKLMVPSQIAKRDESVYDDGWWASVLAEDENRDLETASDFLKKEESSKPSPDWERAMSLYHEDGIVEMIVIGNNRGGLLVEGEGFNGFVPCSHLVDLPLPPDEDRREDTLSIYLGCTLRLKVIECVPEESRMVFSERAALAEAGKRPALFNTIQAGQHITGEVTNVTKFGVFVDLGGVEGLIHISELSWGRVSHPAQVCQVGQQVEVQVMEVSPERCRIALSLKRLLPNPWEFARERYPVNMVVSAVVTALVPFGAFARLEEGLEGLIHASEIPLPPNKRVKDILIPGQSVQVRVLQVESERQRLGLSLKIN